MEYEANIITNNSFSEIIYKEVLNQALHDYMYLLNMAWKTTESHLYKMSSQDTGSPPPPTL